MAAQITWYRTDERKHNLSFSHLRVSLLKYMEWHEGSLSHEDQEDAVQEALLKLLERCPEEIRENQTRMFAWLTTTVVRDATRTIKQKQKFSSFSEGAECDDGDNPGPGSPHVFINRATISELATPSCEDEVVARTTGEMLLHDLPQRTGEIFQKHIEGKSAREIAKDMAMKPAAVDKALSRARTQMREALAPPRFAKNGESECGQATKATLNPHPKIIFG